MIKYFYDKIWKSQKGGIPPIRPTGRGLKIISCYYYVIILFAKVPKKVHHFLFILYIILKICTGD
jgi:hypothetical protein